MPRDAPTGQTLDGDTFNQRLRELLRDAHESGVEVRGAWECRNTSNSVPDWDVQIAEVRKPDDR